MRLPEFITFTGADDATPIAGMKNLAAFYPVEWGVLFSRSRQGAEARYPAEPCRFIGHGLRLAAHLCGAYSREVMAGTFTEGIVGFDRVQVNHPAPDELRLTMLQGQLGRRVIAQTRGDFPRGALMWLFDRSGGTGTAPTSWPRHPGWQVVGYAGGIGPDNVLDVLRAIDSAGPYWIDMESGVRTDDRFDLEKCRRVCELVYGARS